MFWEKGILLEAVVTHFNVIDFAKFSKQSMNTIKLSKYLLKYHAPFRYLYLVTAAHRLTYQSPERAILETALLCSITTTGFSFFFSAKNKDPVNDYVNKDLTNLCRSLTSLDIDTDLDLIRDSKTNGNSIGFKLYKGVIPCISHYKYIIIPSYNSMGEKTETSVIQTHPLFSRRYILTRGSKQSKKSPVKAKIALESA